MLKLLDIIFAVTVSATLGQAQTSWVQLNWQDKLNAPGTVSYNVYRSSGSCPQSYSRFTLVANTGIIPSGGNFIYIDQTVTPGGWCYVLTTFNGIKESAHSNQAGTVVPNSDGSPFAPAALVPLVIPSTNSSEVKK